MASSRELFILSLIARRPTYGYEIKQFLSDAVVDVWTNISTPHIYHTLSKLEKAGLIEARSERCGCQPTREVYSVTQKGQKTLIEMLHDDQYLDQQIFFDFDIVLAAIGGMRSMKDEERTQIIKRRIGNVEATIRRRQEMSQLGRVSKFSDTLLVQAIARHKSEFLETELAWLKGVLQQVETLGWRAFATRNNKVAGELAGANVDVKNTF